MSRRYSVHPAVLQSARAGSDYTDICLPDRDAWVRLGPREADLLRGLTGRSVEELRSRFAAQFTGEEIAAALERFDSLGLLDDSAAGADTTTAGRPARPVVFVVPIVVSAVLVIWAIVSIPIIIGRITWPGLLAGRPPFGFVLGLVLVAALVHEAGHALAAVLLSRGDVRCRLRLGWITIIPILRLQLTRFWGLSRGAQMCVACAGPAAHVTLAAAATDGWITWLAVTGAGPPFLLWYAAVNVTLAVINALPLYPLDGYWILSLALERPWLWKESVVYRLISSAGLVVLCAIALAGAGARLVGR